MAASPRQQHHAAAHMHKHGWTRRDQTPMGEQRHRRICGRSGVHTELIWVNCHHVHLCVCKVVLSAHTLATLWLYISVILGLILIQTSALTIFPKETLPWPGFTGDIISLAIFLSLTHTRTHTRKCTHKVDHAVFMPASARLCACGDDVMSGDQYAAPCLHVFFQPPWVLRFIFPPLHSPALERLTNSHCAHLCVSFCCHIVSVRVVVSLGGSCIPADMPKNPWKVFKI